MKATTPQPRKTAAPISAYQEEAGDTLRASAQSLCKEYREARGELIKASTVPKPVVTNRSTEHLDKAISTLRKHAAELKGISDDLKSNLEDLAAIVSERTRLRQEVKAEVKHAVEVRVRSVVPPPAAFGEDVSKKRYNRLMKLHESAVNKAERKVESIVGRVASLLEKQQVCCKAVDNVLSKLAVEYPEIEQLNSVALFEMVCKQLTVEDPIIKDAKACMILDLEVGNESTQSVDSGKALTTVFTERGEHLSTLGQECISQLQGLSHQIKSSWSSPSRFGGERAAATPVIQGLAEASFQLLEYFSDEIARSVAAKDTLADQLLRATGLMMQNEDSRAAQVLEEIKKLSPTEEQWKAAVDSLQGIDQESSQVLSGVLGRLGRSDEVTPAPTIATSSDSFTEYARTVFDDRSAVDQMIYEVLAMTQSHEAALEALFLVEQKLLAALGSQEAAEAFLRIRPALVIDYVEDPQSFDQYCTMLFNHGPVMAVMHEQGALNVHDFTSLEAIESLDRRVLGVASPSAPPPPSLAPAVHEEAIQLLRDLGIPSPNVAYVYLSNGPFKVSGLGQYVNEQLRQKGFAQLFPQQLSPKLRKKIEGKLIAEGVLNNSRTKDRDAVALRRFDEINGVSPEALRTRRLLELIAEQFTQKMPELEPD